MSLHRALTADWQDVPQSQRSGLQKLAAQTKGYVTVGNGITVVGLVLVAVGFLAIWRGHLIAGAVLVGIGRIADLLDGYAADWTGTKSPVGEAFDATVDKIELAIAIWVLFFSAYASRLLWLCLLAHLAVTLFLFVAARLRGTRLHPTRAGKLSAVAVWLAAGLFLLHRASLDSWLQQSLAWAAFICAVAFVGLAVVSTVEYGKQLRGGDL